MCVGRNVGKKNIIGIDECTTLATNFELLSAHKKKKRKTASVMETFRKLNEKKKKSTCDSEKFQRNEKATTIMVKL